MAKPRDLYSGPAPQAMGMMGVGIADAYARAGEIEGKGMQALGQGLAQGIEQAGKAFAGYVMDKKDFAATKAMALSPQYQRALGINEEQAKQIVQDMDRVQGAGGYRAANQQFGNLFKDLYAYNQMAEMNKYKLQQIGVEQTKKLQQIGTEQYLKLLGTPSVTPQATVTPAPQAVPAETPPAQTKGISLIPGTIVLPGKTKKSSWSTFEPKNMGFGE